MATLVPGLVSRLEACCRVLMLGVTAAALMAIMQQMIKAQGEEMRLD